MCVNGTGSIPTQTVTPPSAAPTSPKNADGCKVAAPDKETIRSDFAHRSWPRGIAKFRMAHNQASQTKICAGLLQLESSAVDKK